MTIQNPQEFEKALHQIVELLLKKGLIPPQTNVNDLVKKVSEKLTNDTKIQLTNDSLKNPETQKSLALSCMIAANPKNNFDFTLLFKSEMKLELKKEISKLLDNILELKPDGKSGNQKELDKNLLKLSELLLNEMKNEKALLNTVGSLVNQFDKLTPDYKLSDQQLEADNFARLYNSPQTPGAITPVVQNIMSGNENGILDVALAGAESYLGQIDCPNTGVPDPTGTRLLAVIAEVGQGAPIDTPSELKEAIEKEPASSFHPSPFSTSPSPFSKS